MCVCVCSSAYDSFFTISFLYFYKEAITLIHTHTHMRVYVYVCIRFLMKILETNCKNETIINRCVDIYLFYVVSFSTSQYFGSFLIHEKTY